MWAHKGLNDSANGMVKPMFNFGRAPNTAGGPFGTIGGSQEGGIF